MYGGTFHSEFHRDSKAFTISMIVSNSNPWSGGNIYIEIRLPGTCTYQSLEKGDNNYLNPFSTGTDLRRSNLPSVDIADDFKFKKSFGLLVYINIFHG